MCLIAMRGDALSLSLTQSASCLALALHVSLYTFKDRGTLIVVA